MLKVSLLICAVAAFASLVESGVVTMGNKCLLNSDCLPTLSCDVRIEPITNTCLLRQGQTCTKDLDCANDLDCVSGKCNCPAGYFYDAQRNDCFKKQIFGESCWEQGQCGDALRCSVNGALVEVCLQQHGALCAQDADCANNQKCEEGACGCWEQYEKFNATSQDCDIIHYANRDKKCMKDSDCADAAHLACDNTVNGYQSNSCLRILDEFCNTELDCANGLICAANHFCECEKGQFYDYSTNDCYFPRQLREPCNENSDCAENLACDVKVEPTPISAQRNFYCLKEYGVQCRNGSECVNYLPCNNGLCGCRPNYYFEEELEDCFPQLEFGRPCDRDAECLSGLACDMAPDGAESYTCSYLPGARCGDYSDCVNSVECLAGYCGCPATRVFDPKTNECILRVAAEEEVAAEVAVEV